MLTPDDIKKLFGATDEQPLPWDDQTVADVIAAESYAQRLLVQHGKTRPKALEEALERAVANARRAGHDGLLVNALHLLGQARGLRGDRAALGDLDEAASMAQREGWQWLAADVRDSRGRALLQLGELEAGVAELSAAADDLAAAEDSFNGAFSIATAAQALRGAERNTAAVACFESALERLRSADPQHPAIPAVIGDLADALTAAGRSADADRLRASLPE